MPSKKQSKKSDDSKLFAFLAVLLSIVGFIIAYVVKKDDKYVMFYAKQSLVLFITSIIFWIVKAILSVLFLGVIGWILDVLLLVLWIFALVYSLSGEMKDTPLIGQYAEKFNL